LSLPEFANREELEPQRLRRWQRRLAREDRPARAPRPARRTVPVPPALIELRPTPNPSPPRAEAIEILLASGVVVRVADTIDPAALARLVTALRGC
jgi:transposase-like protein